MSAQRLSVVLLVLGVLSLPVSAWAGGESGFYLGAGIGQADVAGSVPGVTTSYEGDDTAYKIIAGYNFGLVPLVDVAVEGSYVDFGKIEDSANAVKYEQTALDAFGLVGLTFGPMAFFGKVGMVSWDADTTVNNIPSSDSGTDPAYGIGVRLQILSISARLEYELFDLDNVDDLTMTSLSVLYTF